MFQPPSAPPNIPCSCGKISLPRTLWAFYEGSLLDAWGEHRTILDCRPVAQLDSASAGISRITVIKPEAKAP